MFGLPMMLHDLRVEHLLVWARSQGFARGLILLLKHEAIDFHLGLSRVSSWKAFFAR